MKFENPLLPTYALIIDPPCVSYDLKKDESLLLKITYSAEVEKAINELVTFRVSNETCMNIDVDVDCKIFIIFNDNETEIWPLV